MTNNQPLIINGKPATQAEVSRIMNAGKKSAQTSAKKSRETAPVAPKGFSFMR
jgi:hypothetical protein